MRAAFDMKSAQIGSAYRAPYPSGPIVAGLSNPTHTPATSDDEKPTNHASLKSSVVPVLPAAGKRTPSDARRRAGAHIDDVGEHRHHLIRDRFRDNRLSLDRAVQHRVAVVVEHLDDRPRRDGKAAVGKHRVRRRQLQRRRLADAERERRHIRHRRQADRLRPFAARAASRPVSAASPPPGCSTRTALREASTCRVSQGSRSSLPTRRGRARADR